MKKLYTILLAAACVASIEVSAQQLPNADFETGWAKTTPYTGSGASTKQTDGLSPANWKISHVAGYKVIVSWLGTTLVGERVTGYGNTGYAPLLKNVPNSIAKSQKVPGYITLGTPFNTAKSDGSEKDGGTFGGISFAYRPDALSIQYKRTQAAGSAEQATVVAYLWKGTVTQSGVRARINSTTTETMTNRDRNILGMETPFGDTPSYSSDYERVATLNHAITEAAAEWTNLVIPFTYEKSSTPTMANVIFSAGNYFSTDPEEGNQLTVDNVKLLYYSRLASLSVNDTPVAGFDSNTYEYDMSDMEMPEESAFSYTTLGTSGSANVAVALDKANAKATLTVTNSNPGGTDADGETSHVYALQFKKVSAPVVEPDGVKYKGTLSIKLEALEIDQTQPDSVYIYDNGNGTCKFTLPQFTLALPGVDPANFGDIVVDNISMTENADGSVSYSGSVTGLSLAGGEIVADVVINGSEKDGVLTMTLPVTWDGMTIDVAFNGQNQEGSNPEPVVPEGVPYDGTLNIKLELISLDETQQKTVYIKDNGDGTCRFTLPQFVLALDPDQDPANFGDIVVDNIVMTRTGNTTTYAGSVKGLSLANGEIKADVDIEGTEDENGNLSMKIPVTWDGLSIDVTFNGLRDTAGIGGVFIDNGDAAVEYYNLKGMRVNGENLAPGIYIRRQGTDVKKIQVR